MVGALLAMFLRPLLLLRSLAFATYPAHFRLFHEDIKNSNINFHPHLSHTFYIEIGQDHVHFAKELEHTSNTEDIKLSIVTIYTQFIIFMLHLLT
jgi:hypothetical protein